MSSSPRAEADEDKALLQMKEITEWLSKVVSNQEKSTALVNMTDNDAQSMIDYLSALASHRDFLQIAEPKLRKRTLTVLHDLCENSTLYPTCNTLDGIENLSQINVGGFFDIFRGRCQGQDLCLKVVRVYNKQSQDELLKAHASEAVLWSQLEHSNITPTRGFFRLKEMDSRICLLSPWMENGNIVDYLERQPGVPRRPFLHDIASGLEYLHKNNIVHGDLKGVNVLVDEFSTACLADFGVSKIITDATMNPKSTTNPNHNFTARWTPLEVLEKKARPSKESDIWAFGCVCFEILTRLLPYRACTTDAQVIRKLLSKVLPAQSADHALDEDHAVNDEIWKLLGQCWSFDATERPKCSDVLQVMKNNPKVWGITFRESEHDANCGRQFDFTASINLLDRDQARQWLKRKLNRLSTVNYPDPMKAGDTEGTHIVEQGQQSVFLSDGGKRRKLS